MKVGVVDIFRLAAAIALCVFQQFGPFVFLSVDRYLEIGILSFFFKEVRIVMKMMMIYCSKLSTSPGRKASQKSPPLLDPNSIPNSHSSPGAGGSITSKVSQGLEPESTQ